jgi:uncharacterized protein
MAIKYLDAARQGQNKWWQYIVGLLIPWATLIMASLGIFILFLTLGIIHFSDFRPPLTSADLINRLPLWAYYILSIALLSLMCISSLVWIEKAHQRSPFSVICPDSNQVFHIKRCFNAFIVWFAISLLLSGGLLNTYMYDPQAIKIIADPINWLIYLIPAIVLVVVTALYSEITRGYVLQGIGLITKQRHVVMGLSGLLMVCLIALSNQNRPLYIQIQQAIYAFIFSVGLAMFIFKENGLELVLGIAIANGLGSKIISYQSTADSTLPAAIISIDRNSHTYSSSIAIGLVLLCIKLTIFYAIFFRGNLPLTQK